MAQKAESKKTPEKKGGDKARVHMPLALKVSLDKVGTFGNESQHMWFTATEPDSGTKLMFKSFNCGKLYDTVLNNDTATVYFDIVRSKQNNGDYITQLVAYDVVSAKEG